MQTKVLWFVAILPLLIEFRVSSQEPDEICGRRIFTEPTGTINFTALRFAASRNSTCNYRIEVGEDNVVSLKFLYFDLPTYLDFCNHNWMTISCITDEISETLVRKSPLLCGQTKWSSALKLSECPVLSVEIVFSSDLIFDRKGFQLQYEISPTAGSNTSDENAIPEIECGETFLTNHSGAIVLPNNPNITRAKLNCTYTISTSEPDTLISLLTLDVSYIDLLTLTDDIDGCEQDHLQIRCSDEDEQDPDSSGCAIFSSDSFSRPVYRGCLTLEITLKSDSYDPGETRLINYDMTVERLDEDDNTFDHGGNAVCGNSTYKELTGNVTSPRFPLAHPDNLNCTYRIAVGKQNALSLKFLFFNLEGSAGSCGVDWIAITCVFNSPPNFLNAPRLCGRKESPFVLRYWNCSSVYLQFRTDGSVSAGGFNIQYSVEHKDSVNITEPECGQTEFNSSDGVITLPNNPSGYASQINCTYSVVANATSNFHLNVSSLNLARIYSRLGRCIQLSCTGENSRSYSLCNHYGFSFVPEFVLYNCQTLQIPIVSSFFELQESCRIPFKVIASDAICGEKSLSGSNGTISFPYIYPSYHANTKCNYTIRGGNNTTISIVFDRSQYRYPDYRHCFDRITMFCLNSPNWNLYTGKRFCSQLRWPSVMHFFNCSALLIAFSSYYSTNTVGFSLNYAVSMGEIKDAAENIPNIPCGGSFSALSGTMSLPTQAGVPMVSISCVYTISLNSIRKGSISIDFAQLSNAFDYNSDRRAVNLTILCSSDVASGEINGAKSLTFGGADLPRTLTEFSVSVCDSIRLSIQSSSYYPADYRDMSFKIKNTECGNVSLDGSTGNVMSPFFPLPYGKGLNCAYYIEVGDENFITLQFLAFSLSGFSRDTPVLPSYHYHYHYNDYKFGEQRSSDVYRYDNCYYDHLTIRCLFNGSQITSDSKYLNRALCGNKTVTRKIFGCQALRLEFITGDSGSSRMPGFNIHYHIQDANNSDVHCGNSSFDDPSGVITSPGYPDHYSSGLNCTYAIKAGQNKSAMIEVLFLDLQPASYRYIDGKSLYICSYDWLELSCSSEDATIANQIKNRRFCGHQRPFTMLLRGCEHVFIYFSSDSTVALNGFRIQYKIYTEDEECGNTVFSNSTGIITSPGYPGPYPHRINCTYYIEVGSNNSLSLQLLSLDVGFHYERYYGYHYSSICLNDFMRITCSSRDAGEKPFTSQYLDKQFCGNRHSFSATFRRCKQYAVEFFSGGNYSKSGFKLHYTIKTPDEECGKTVLSNSTGIITSPGFPGRYPQGTVCTYYIEVGSNSSLSLQLLSFDVGYNPYNYHYDQWASQCLNDFIRINCSSRDPTEAPFTSQYLNKKLCGQRHSFTTIFKRCNQYAVEFFSGGDYSKSGFRFLYTINKLGEECGNTVFSNSTGIITSPGYPGQYPQGKSCTYYIEVGSNNSLSLQFLSFEVGNNPYNNPYNQWPSQCPNDFIRINCSSRDPTEAPFTSQYLNKKFCGRRYSYSFTTNFKRCNQYALEFFSSGDYSKSGFQFLYKINKSEEECGSTEFSNSTGVITSPGFPAHYVHHLNCTYYIDIGSKLLVLNFSNFDIGYNQYPQHCPSDWLQITCVSRRTDVSMVTYENINTKLCGNRYNFNVTLDGCSRAAIQFISTESQQRTGFKLQYETIKSGYCGYSSNNFTDDAGTIVSPYLLMGRRLPPTTCNCLISAQQMSTISLAITAMPLSLSCTANWLSIKCLDDGNSLSYSPKICGARYLYENVVLPSCSSVQLIYPSTSYAIQFVISYRVAAPEEVCGKSVFTGPTGYISFPKSSSKYKTKFNCSYSVFVGIYNSISFELSSFVDNDENNETSPNDWISIFCHGNSDNGQNRITHNDSIQSKEPMTLSFTNCNTVDIVFHSENQTTDRRFNVSYTIRANYKPSNKRFVQTGSFGVLIAFILLLIVASLVALTVVWLRRRGTKPKEDENTLTVADSEFETPDSQGKWRRGRFNLWSFIPFRSKSRENNDRQKGLVPLEPMDSSLSRAHSEQSVQSNPCGVSSDRDPIIE